MVCGERVDVRVVKGWDEGGERMGVRVVRGGMRVVRVNYHSWEICVVRWWV